MTLLPSFFSATVRTAFQREVLVLVVATMYPVLVCAQTCQSNCGELSIRYPWGLEYGCGDATFQELLLCNNDGSSASRLDLIVHSGNYEVRDLDYSNKTLDILDSSMYSCDDVSKIGRSFKLNASGPLQLSKTDKFLFIGCNASIFSEYSCVNNSALCRTYLSRCATTLFFGSCCEHSAEPYDSIDVNTLHCISYASFYSTVSSSVSAQWPFGFHLQFLQNASRASACNQCVASNGVCGYNSTHPFICMCTSTNSTTDCSADCGRGSCVSSDTKNRSIIIGSVIATVLVTCSLLMVCWRWRSRPSNQPLPPSEGMSDSPVEFTLKELAEATDNFREKLGSGGYASVYKGILVNGTIVAVKKLSLSRQTAKVFRAEVSTLGSINHINLVKLVGYCSENSERLLVYEYMPNGSLDRFLFNPKTDIILHWKQRIEIALGTARGIAYLHEGSRKRIIHCDIKPANILLDENFTAKVADFGLAKLMEREQNWIDISAIKGTPGYMAPEWLKGTSAVTEKSDVYSFGMVLLEIFGGRKNADPAAHSTSRFFLPTWATSAAQRNDFTAVLDPRLNGDVDENQAATFISVSILCIQTGALLRPGMNDVVKMLEGTMEVSRPLPKSPTSPQITSGKMLTERKISTILRGGLLTVLTKWYRKMIGLYYY